MVISVRHENSWGIVFSLLACRVGGVLSWLGPLTLTLSPNLVAVRRGKLGRCWRDHPGERGFRGFFRFY